MLEEMSSFFEARLKGYDEHMLDSIEGAREFYPFTASLLPSLPGSRVLDLGCGTGLELACYFELNPSACVTGIDLSQGMLSALADKLSSHDITLLCGSYFDLPFGENHFDAAVSVESLHHFTADEKLPMYERLHRSLKESGYFILTDYFAPSDDAEALYRRLYLQLKKEQGLGDQVFYHYDTPLTVQHEAETLLAAGFSSVEIQNRWGATCTLRATR